MWRSVEHDSLGGVLTPIRGAAAVVGQVRERLDIKHVGCHFLCPGCFWCCCPLRQQRNYVLYFENRKIIRTLVGGQNIEMTNAVIRKQQAIRNVQVYIGRGGWRRAGRVAPLKTRFLTTTRLCNNYFPNDTPSQPHLSILNAEMTNWRRQLCTARHQGAALLSCLLGLINFITFSTSSSSAATSLVTL